MAESTRALYGLGEYEKAIYSAEAVIQSNRHYEHGYEYLILAHKAKGEWESAIVAAKRAVRYETPWDDKRVAVLKQELVELEAEYERVKVSKAVGALLNCKLEQAPSIASQHLVKQGGRQVEDGDSQVVSQFHDIGMY
jgi:tetratricopeptide (TPR) repeat protein